MQPFEVEIIVQYVMYHWRVIRCQWSLKIESRDHLWYRSRDPFPSASCSVWTGDPELTDKGSPKHWRMFFWSQTCCVAVSSHQYCFVRTRLTGFQNDRCICRAYMTSTLFFAVRRGQPCRISFWNLDAKLHVNIGTLIVTEEQHHIAESLW